MNASANITITVNELIAVINQAAEMAVAKYVAQSDPRNDLISQRKAYNLYGAARVNQWKECGLIKNRGRVSGSSNSKILYSKSELQQAEYADRVKGATFMRR